MITECRNYLASLLTSSGIKTSIITRQKDLNNNNEQHLGAVLLQKESIEKKTKVKIGTVNNTKTKRTQKFERQVQFVVIIGEYDMEHCESIYDNFLNSISNGINIDDNYVEINMEQDIDWVEKEDSILKSTIAVQILVTFIVGVFTDTQYKNVNINISKEGEI